MTFKHVSFLTTDLGRTLNFYALLGTEVSRHEQTAEGYHRAVLDLGGGRLQLFQIAGEVPASHGHWAEHLALEVLDLPGLVARLEAAGIRSAVRFSPVLGGRLMAFVRDPDGRSVELLQVRAEG